MRTALTIAGSDSCGGAGIQADLKVFSVLGVYGMSALTAITAQNTQTVASAVELDPAFVRQQIEVVASDIAVDACKTGMLSSERLVVTVAEAIRANRLTPYVCDPVMFSKGGSALLRDDAIDAVKRHLLPLAAVVTPNRREAALLAGVSVESLSTVAAAREAGDRLLACGARSVVIKGIECGNQMVDVFCDGRQSVEFTAERHGGNGTHGSGCAFSAAITAGLANQMDLIDAIHQAKRLVTLAVQFSAGQGHGMAPVNVLAFATGRR